MFLFIDVSYNVVLNVEGDLFCRSVLNMIILMMEEG